MNQKFKQLKEQENKTAKIVAIAVAVVLIIGVALTLIISKGINSKVENNKEKIIANTNTGIIKEEIYENLKFNNITLITEKGTSTLSMDVTNTSDQSYTGKQIDVVFKDKNSNEIITLLGYIGEDLKPKETRNITASTAIDLSKAYIKEIKGH